MKRVMKKTEIAVLGSTSHIAKGLIHNFLKTEGRRLHLFTRSQASVSEFLSSMGTPSGNAVTIHEGYSEFGTLSYDVIINCVGVGTARKLKGNYSDYFTVTEEYDNLCIGYLRTRYPDSIYISISSGAVYGRAFSAPVKEDTLNSIRVNHITTEDYYGIARLNAETKHRSFNALNIVDLRLFSYFSRFIDIGDGYFMSDVMDSILNRKVLVTDDVNIVRDYVHPEDLFSIVTRCIDIRVINDAFDVTSSKPVEKRELLDYFSARHGLKWSTCGSPGAGSPTGSKSVYCSNSRKAETIGYHPRFTSMETVAFESDHILNPRNQHPAGDRKRG